MQATMKNAETTIATSPTSPDATPPVPAPAPVPPVAGGGGTGVVTTMTDPAVQECLALLDEVLTKTGKQSSLSGGQVRRSTKMRKGGAGVIPKILALCKEHGVTSIGSLTTQEMSDELQRGDALQQVGLRAALVQKTLKDGAMAAHGRSWRIATTMYTTLQRLAVDEPDLALGLVPIQSFFQTKKTKGQVRKKKHATAVKKLEKLANHGAGAVSGGAAPPTQGAAGSGQGGLTAPSLGPVAPPAPLNGAAH